MQSQAIHFPPNLLQVLVEMRIEVICVLEIKTASVNGMGWRLVNRIIHRLPKSTGLTTGNDFVVIKAKLDMKVKEPDSQLKGNLMRPFIHSFNTCALGSYVPGGILDP